MSLTNRNETRLLVENWRKVLKDGLDENSSELLEEGFKDWLIPGLIFAQGAIGCASTQQHHDMTPYHSHQVSSRNFDDGALDHARKEFLSRDKADRSHQVVYTATISNPQLILIQDAMSLYEAILSGNDPAAAASEFLDSCDKAMEHYSGNDRARRAILDLVKILKVLIKDSGDDPEGALNDFADSWMAALGVIQKL